MAKGVFLNHSFNQKFPKTPTPRKILKYCLPSKGSAKRSELDLIRIKALIKAHARRSEGFTSQGLGRNRPKYLPQGDILSLPDYT